MTFSLFTGWNANDVCQAEVRYTKNFRWPAGKPAGSCTAAHREFHTAVDANPLDDLQNLMKISGVMVRGRWISKDELQQMAEGVARLHASKAS